MPVDLRKTAHEAANRVEQAVEHNETRLLRWGSGIALVFAGAVASALILLSLSPTPQGGSAPEGGEVQSAAFTPPDPASIPDGPDGDAIRRGLAIFTATYSDPSSRDYVGNGMSCSNCHLDAGRKAGSSPMWAAWVGYPKYRKKNNSINTITDRIHGCFVYSMNAQDSRNGKAPAADSDIYRDLESYFAWLAKGTTTGATPDGAGYTKIDAPKGGYDPVRGKAVYQQACAGCHGDDGQGAQQPDGKVVYPALWGPHSFNWGAGMGLVNNAAAFIHKNMPFDNPGSLTEQQAWDVAAYVDSQERPKDPRQTGSVADNAKTNFADAKTFYGTMLDGRLVGVGVPGSPYAKLPAGSPAPPK